MLERSFAKKIYFVECQKYFGIVPCRLPYGWVKRETLSAINAGYYSVSDFADTYYTKTPASLKFERVRQNFDK